MKKIWENKLLRADVLLLLLFVSILSVLLLRINAEGTGYLSPDSLHYLGLAQNLKDGHGFYLEDESGRYTQFFTKWPIGYPSLIYFTSALSGLDIFWASKLLNIILLASVFLVFYYIYPKYSFVLATLCCSYTLMEIYSFTWSEAPFLLIILLMSIIVHRICNGGANLRNALLVYLCCLALFLLRYAGLYSVAIPALLVVHFYIKRDFGRVKLFTFILGITALSIVAYLFINFKLSGYATGLDRLEDETEPLSDFVLMSLKGLLNEFLIIREYRPQNQPDYLLYITALIQVAVLTFITIKVKRHYNYWQELKQNSFSMICVGIALLYLAAIIAMRLVSHFDALDYRLLAPFSFPLFIGLVYALVSLPDKHKDIVQAKYALFAFFLLSLLLNLPKKFILQQLQQIL